MTEPEGRQISRHDVPSVDEQVEPVGSREQSESTSEVSAALVPRSAEVAADIYHLIVQEIPALHRDGRVLALLEASVAENVSTMLHVLQHGIDLENVRAPAAAEEYARRLAQQGVPLAALLRAYRIGSARFEEWCLQELGRRTDSGSIVSATGMRIAGTLNSYIDGVSEELVSAYEAEKEKWLRNQSAARAARVRALLRNEQPSVDASEAILGYRLRQYHLGVVTWITGAPAAVTRSGCWSGRPARWRPRPSATGGSCSSRRTSPARGPGCRWAGGVTSRWPT